MPQQDPNQLTEQHIKEGLSLAYISAVAFRAGVNLEIGPEHYDYGVDGTFASVVYRNGKRKNSGKYLDFQAKATWDWEVRGDEIVYDLETHTYNDLVSRMKEYEETDNTTAQILILFCLPRAEDDWLHCDEDRILLRKCCYFKIVKGAPVTDNGGTKRIKIPRANALTPQAVKDLLNRVKDDTL